MIRPHAKVYEVQPISSLLLKKSIIVLQLQLCIIGGAVIKR